MLEKYKEKIGSSFDIKDENAYKQNLIKLEVYYEEFNFETIDEIPGYKVRTVRFKEVNLNKIYSNIVTC